MMTLHFKDAGHHIFLLGKSTDDIGCSEYLYSYHKVKYSTAPVFDLEEEFAVQKLIRELIAMNLVSSAHDVSDGGLFISLLESAMAGKKGFAISTDEDYRKDAFLFGESQGRIVVSVSEDQLDAFTEMVADSGLEFMNLGETTEEAITVDDENFGLVSDFRMVYENAIASKMNA